MNSTSTPRADAPWNADPSPSDAPAWHRRLCVAGDRIVVSGDLPVDERLVARLAPQVEYRYVGIDDDGTRRPDEWFDTGTNAALELLESNDGRVLVHCHMGINRGPSMAYAVLLTLGWDHLVALETIRAVRPIAALIYAEDAVTWWARRNGIPTTAARAMRRDVHRWHKANDIDVAKVIRRIRTAS